MPGPIAVTGDTSNVIQTLYREGHPAIHVTTLQEDQLTREVLEKFANNSIVGLSGEYKSCQLKQLVLSTPQEALRICISPKTKISKRDILSRIILLNPAVVLIAFNLDRLALALHMDMDMKINNGVDMISLRLLSESVTRTSIKAVTQVMDPGGELAMKSQIACVFQGENGTPKGGDSPILRAWSARHVARLATYERVMLSASRVDTTRFEKKQLDLLAKLLRDSFRLEALKPTFTKNDISKDISLVGDKVGVIGTRYKTKLRVSGSQSVRLELKGDKSQGGRVKKVDGRSAYISTDKVLRKSDIRGITTIGKEEPTSAESMKTDIILKTLQGSISLFHNPIVSSVWFSADPGTSIFNLTSKRPLGATIPLNPAQIRAVHSMLRHCSPDDAVQVTMVHGPPGSGKTSVAAGFVEAIQRLSRSEYGEAVYLTAQSNVAVKNMAEKLVRIGFTDWKLIVSRDFHFDWHEHLYEAMQSNVIESGNLPQSHLEVERLLRGVRVLLCTLSMLSSKRLEKITLQFPPRTVIVDEASQIGLGDYLPVFHIFGRTLRRICFVGDDKQLAPFGQDDIPELQSAFEIPGLRKHAIFLNIQYRMPTSIGKFISREVYGGKLESSHPDQSKTSCRWVDVANGVEQSEGRSWKNSREVQTVVRLVRQAHKMGEDFRVITPYDPQRNELERALKTAKLPWENRCFNVDSFQGNEADHIIVSIVRTKKPGFLVNERRTNVMLTRCKRKMTICSNRYFLEHEARKTLVGRMAAAWGTESWVSGKDV